jgi:hypothetical protein
VDRQLPAGVYETVKLPGLVTVPVGAWLFVPVVAPVGTVACSSVEETNVVWEDAFPLNFTADLLLKPMPLIVTTVPIGPLVGVKLVIDSVGVKELVLVPDPCALVTEIVPVVAPLGTTAVI